MFKWVTRLFVVKKVYDFYKKHKAEKDLVKRNNLRA